MEASISRSPGAQTGLPTTRARNVRTDRSRGNPTPENQRAIAEEKGWDSLARYKFFMFGYWCATWVQMNRLCAQKADNPWRELVMLARQRTDRLHKLQGH